MYDFGSARRWLFRSWRPSDNTLDPATRVCCVSIGSINLSDGVFAYSGAAIFSLPVGHYQARAKYYYVVASARTADATACVRGPRCDRAANRVSSCASHQKRKPCA